MGLVKVKAAGIDWKIVAGKVPAGNSSLGARGAISSSEIVEWCQNCLFAVQAEIAGADKRVDQSKVAQMEGWINGIESEMPPIKTFFVSGGTELATLLDVSRTLARKAERRVVGGIEAEELRIAPVTLAFLNRLSSLLYALARLTNHKSGIKEVPPTYN